MRVTLLSLLVVAASCAQIGLQQRTEDEWFDEATRSILNSHDVSEVTKNILRRRSLDESYRQDPVGAIRELQRELKETGSRPLCVAIAELGLLQQQRVSVLDRRAVGTALRFSYAYLFDPRLNPPPNEFDSQFRWACDLYNRALAKFVRASTKESRARQNFVFEWYDEEAEIGLGHNDLDFLPKELEKIRVAYDYRVKGLPSPDSRRGFGLPVVLERNWSEDMKTRQSFRYLPEHLVFPATLLLRFPDDVSILDDEPGIAQLEMFDPMQTVRTRIGKRDVALDIDLTTPVATLMAQGDQSVNLKALLNPDEFRDAGRLYMFNEYRKGRIPVLLIHGLASDPMTWIPMYTDLVADPVIRERCQFLFWFYPTGQPVFISTQQIRKALSEAMRSLDPKREDVALDWMVVCGHSMGGLLTRSMVVDPGDALWTAAFEVPYSDLEGKAPEEGLRYLRDAFYFESLPFIRRAIFYATPHRGSPGAKITLAQWAQRFISMPSDIVDPLTRAARAAKPKAKLTRATSVSSLRDDSPTLLAMADLPINPRTIYHSVIGDNQAAGRKGGTDGIVPYDSSHVPGAASELIVHSGHSVQRTPEASRETIRILHAHIAAFDAALQDPKPSGR